MAAVGDRKCLKVILMRPATVT
jgi:hypothetical protein